MHHAEYTESQIYKRLLNIHNSLLDNCDITNMPKGPLVFNFSTARDLPTTLPLY